MYNTFNVDGGKPRSVSLNEPLCALKTYCTDLPSCAEHVLNRNIRQLIAQVSALCALDAYRRAWKAVIIDLRGCYPPGIAVVHIVSVVIVTSIF